MHPYRLLLATESLATKNSGIGRVARLMARVLGAHMAEKRWDLYAVSLSDRQHERLEWPWAAKCGGRRLEYVLRAQARGMGADAVLYDSLSMARAHFMGPARSRPALAWMHGIEVWEKAWPVHLSVARRVNVLVTNSEYTRRRAAALHPGLERAQICWLGTETDEPVSLSPDPDEPPTVLILARLDTSLYKGHTELINVWPEIVQRVPGARLRIAGGGPGLDGVRQAVACSPVARNIELTDYVPEAEISSVWRQANVFAMPSRGEGFGLVYIEAMRHGIPVIASRQDAGQEINSHGETGFNVDLDQPRDLVEALVTLLTNRAKARTMGMAGQERWQRHFTWSAFQARFGSIMNDFVTSGAKPRLHDS